MSAPLSPTFHVAIAFALISVTTMGGAVPSAVAAEASPSAVTALNPLDGKSFIAQSGEKGKKESNKDTIVFRNGRFLSEGCSPFGFKDAAYQATVDGATIRFHAETHSPTHGTMVWDGTVKDNAIEATSIWTRERWYWKIRREYWYKGQLKNGNRGEGEIPWRTSLYVIPARYGTSSERSRKLFPVLLRSRHDWRPSAPFSAG